MRTTNFIRFLITVSLTFVMLMAFVLVTGIFVRFAWNNVIINVFPSVTALSYWHAAALGIIMSMFVSSSSGKKSQFDSEEQYLKKLLEILVFYCTLYVIVMMQIIIVKQFIT